MSEELKPCPFCGENVWTIYAGCGEDHSVVCENCEAASPVAKSAEDAVKEWNTRPAEDALKAEITRYRRALHNLKEDCTRRKHFAVSDEEKLFLYETILHIEAELDFNTDTEERGRNE